MESVAINLYSWIIISSPLFYVNTTDLGALADLGGANVDMNAIDPVPDEGPDEAPREHEPERWPSSHGSSKSVLALNFDSQVQYKFSLALPMNKNALICSLILNIDKDLSVACEA